MQTILETPKGKRLTAIPPHRNYDTMWNQEETIMFEMQEVGKTARHSRHHAAA